MKNTSSNVTSSIFGLQISTLNLHETAQNIFASLSENKILVREDVNAHKIGLYEKESYIRKALTSSDIVNADGASVVLAHKILFGKTIPRVTGCDLMQELVSNSQTHGRSCFLLGSTNETVELLATQIRDKYGPQSVTDFRDGYFGDNEWPSIVNQINESGADLLFVGTPSPHKEKFITSNLDKLSVKFVMGVGGSFDVLSGKIKRAPHWMQRAGLEWFFRVLQEPRRMWKRYLVANSKFAAILLKEKIKLLIKNR